MAEPIYITWNSQTLSLTAWAEYFGIHQTTLSRRLAKGVPMERMAEPRDYNRRGRPKGAKDLKKRKSGTGLWSRDKQT